VGCVIKAVRYLTQVVADRGCAPRVRGAKNHDGYGQSVFRVFAAPAAKPHVVRLRKRRYY